MVLCFTFSTSIHPAKPKLFILLCLWNMIPILYYLSTIQPSLAYKDLQTKISNKKSHSNIKKDFIPEFSNPLTNIKQNLNSQLEILLWIKRLNGFCVCNCPPPTISIIKSTLFVSRHAYVCHWQWKSWVPFLSFLSSPSLPTYGFAYILISIHKKRYLCQQQAQHIAAKKLFNAINPLLPIVNSWCCCCWCLHVPFFHRHHINIES